MLLKKKDFEDNVEKLIKIKKDIDDIKEKITTIIYIEKIRKICYPDKKKIDNKMKQNCLFFDIIKDELINDIINRFIEKISNQEKRKEIKKIIELEEENNKTEDIETLSQLKEFEKSIFFHDKIGIDEKKKERKEYLKKVYEKIKDEKNISDTTQKKIKDIGINEIQKLNLKLFGTIKEKTDEKKLIIKDLVGLEKPTQDDIFVDLTQIVIDSTQNVIDSNKKKDNKFLLLLDDVYKDDNNKKKLLTFLKPEELSEKVTKELPEKLKSKSKFLKLLDEASKKLTVEKEERINFFDIFNDSFHVTNETINFPERISNLYLSALDLHDINIVETNINDNDWDIVTPREEVIELRRLEGNNIGDSTKVHQFNQDQTPVNHVTPSIFNTTNQNSVFQPANNSLTDSSIKTSK